MKDNDAISVDSDRPVSVASSAALRELAMYKRALVLSEKEKQDAIFETKRAQSREAKLRKELASAKAPSQAGSGSFREEPAQRAGESLVPAPREGPSDKDGSFREEPIPSVGPESRVVVQSDSPPRPSRPAASISEPPPSPPLPLSSVEADGRRGDPSDQTRSFREERALQGGATGSPRALPIVPVGNVEERAPDGQITTTIPDNYSLFFAQCFTGVRLRCNAGKTTSGS